MAKLNATHILVSMCVPISVNRLGLGADRIGLALASIVGLALAYSFGVSSSRFARRRHIVACLDTLRSRC